MILQGSQRRHFYRIFDTFIVYARDYLAERGIIEPKSGPQVMPGAKDVQAIVDAIWGEGGHFEVIDAFEHDPRVTLNRNDKNVVSSWREGIYGSFTAFREGNDVIFLYADYAFCVRGITEEIDEAVPHFPAVLNTVIAPFDGLITYLVLMMCNPMEFSPETQQSMRAFFNDCKDNGRYVRTARQFMKIAAVARATQARDDEEHESMRAELAAHGDDMLEGEHRGELAGLDWEERMRRVDEARREASDLIDKMFALSLIREQCLNGRPQESEAKTIAKYGVNLLRKIAESRGVEGHLSRQELIDYFMGVFPPDAETTLLQSRLLGFDKLQALCKLTQAGGRLHVRSDGSTPLEDTPQPVFPWVAYFREPGGFVASTPRELIDALADTDWDAEFERARRLEEALSWLVIAVEMRGVIEKGEAFGALAERFRDVPVEEATEALMRRQNNALIDIVVDTVDGVEYLAAPDLYDPDTDSLRDEKIRQILEAREGIEPCWPATGDAQVNVLATSMSRPEVQALIRYLDEHVPDGKNNDMANGEGDLLYADLTWSSIITVMRTTDDGGPNVVRFLKELSGSPAQFKRLSDLALKALQTIPLYGLNGHSFADHYSKAATIKKPRLMYYEV